MTDAEQRAWVAMLGKTPTQQMATLRDMLRHARGDKMSAADRTICVRKLRDLEDAELARARAWRA